jgi:hypothetical protein
MQYILRQFSLVRLVFLELNPKGVHRSKFESIVHILSIKTHVFRKDQRSFVLEKLRIFLVDHRL